MAIQRILSPLPGTFYRSPSPDKPPFKSDGDILATGDIIGLVEVMKTFYEVRSDLAGTIVRFVVANEEAIQAGQILAEVEG